MLLNDRQIALLKSISIRSESNARHLLIKKGSLGAFQSFLQAEIQNEVFIVSTNIGMEVFYLSSYDCSALIKKTITTYVNQNNTTDVTLWFKSNNDGIGVYHSFAATIQMFSNYPQVFLAYSKKFLSSLEQNKIQTQLVAILLLFFNDVLEKLKVAGKVPHLRKIEELYEQVTIKVSFLDLDGFLQNKLAKVLLEKVHSN